VLLGLVACGGGSDVEGDDAGGGGDDGGGSVIDAPPQPVMVTVRGVTQTIQGTTTVTLPGATVELYARAGGAALATTTSGSDGTYALPVTLTTGALDMYLKATSAGRLDSYLYPPAALAADVSGVALLIINQQTLNGIGTAGGFTQQAGKGFIALAVADAAAQPLANATVTVTPAGTARAVYTRNGLPSSTATSTDASGAAFLANTNAGDVTVDATMGGAAFREVVVNARPGAFTMTLLQP